MKKSIRILSLFLSIVMVISSFSLLSSVGFSASAAEAPISSFNLQQSLESVSENVEDITSIIPSAEYISYINKPAVNGLKADISIDAQNKKTLNVGVKKTGGAGTPSTSYVFVDFKHPDNAEKYPVKSVSGKSYVYSNNFNNTTTPGGVAFIIGKNVAQDGTVKYLSTGFSLSTNYTQGANYTNETILMIGNQVPLNGTTPAAATLPWNNRANAQQLIDKGYVVNDEGGALTEEQKAAFIKYFAEYLNQKTLTKEEQAFDFKVEPDKSGETVNIWISFTALPGYKDITTEMPEALNIKYSVSLSNKVSGVTTLYTPYVGAVGMFLGNSAVVGEATFDDITVNYDVSSSFAEIYAEQIEGVKQKAKALLSGKGLTADKSSQVDAVIAEYEALHENAKIAIESDKELSNLLNSVNKAKAAFVGGAYYFDSFDGELSYDLEGKVSETEPLVVSATSTLPVYDDNLTPTLEYSADAATNAGDSEGKAFYGIYLDRYNEYNKTLWLRKSFNELNGEVGQRAGDDNWSQNKPSVHYKLKDGILPENARIRSVSGKMFLNDHAFGGAAGFSHIGVTFNYTDEYNWQNIGMSEAYGSYQISKTTRSGKGVGSKTNTVQLEKEIEILKGDKTVIFARGQWLDFSLEYDFDYGCYIYTVSGKDDAGVQKELKIKLSKALELTSTVGFVNASVAAPSFDDISVSLYDAEYFDSKVKELPDTQSITIADEDAINRLSFAYTKLVDSEREKVTTLSRLSSAIERLNKLLYDRDSQFSAETVIDFETNETGEFYFQGENVSARREWGTVDNPSKTGVNNSNKVLKVTKNFRAENAVNTSGKAVYRIKDAILNRDRLISNFTGKVYLDNTSSHSIVFDYVDEDNWQAYKISQRKQTNMIFIYREICEEGVLTIPGGGGGTNLIFETDEEINLESGIWVEFDVEYKLLTATMSLRVYHDGRYIAGKFPLTTTLFETAETQIGFASESTGYFDDIRLLFQGSNDYILAENFKAEHDYILDLVPIEYYASVIDIPYFEKLETEYNSLSAEIKKYLPFMETRVEHIGDVLGQLDVNSSVAKRDNEALEKMQAITGDYSNYTITEDFDNGLTYFQPAYDNKYNTGTATVVYSEQLGSNALRVDGRTDITLKEILLPEKPQLAQVKYKLIAGIETTQRYRQRVYTNFESDDANYALAFYYNTDQRATMFNLQGGNFYNYTKAFDTKLDIKTVWDVEINYDSQGKYEVILTDGNGENYVYNNNASVMALFAIGTYDTETYIDDLTVTYRKGNYEVDIVNEDITAYYTGNVMNNAGDYISLTGENLGNNVFAVSVAPVKNEFSENVGYVNQERFDRTLIAKGDYSVNPTEHNFDNSAAVEARIVQKTDNSIKIQIPTEFANGEKPSSAVYAVKLVNSSGESRIVYVNNPVIDYTMGTDGDIAVANKELRIIGKNIAPIDKDSTKVKLIGNGYDILLPVSEMQSTYSISVKLPYYLSEGKYEVYVYNGYGDNTCWSAPERITVGKDIRSTWKQDVFNVMDYGAIGDGVANDGPAIVNALNAAANNGGGTVYLPEGSYVIESEIIIPEKVRFVGESVKTTSITVRPFNFFYGKLPEAIVKVSSNVEVSDISFIASRIGGVIGSFDPQAENVYIENTYFYSDPAAGAISSAANGLTGLLSVTEMLTMVTHEPINPIFNFVDYGKNIQVRNNDVEDHKVVTSRVFLISNRNGSSFWQVQNNIFYNGGAEIIANSMLYEGNTSRQSAMGVWGHGVYMDDNAFINSMSNNRELYVADRNSLYRGNCIPVSKDADNTQFIIRGSYSYKMQGETQLYVATGQGVGQTRKVIETKPVVSGGISYLYLTIDSPLHIPINANSTIIFRRTRENIFFVDSHFENGSAGGFYGCCADVVYDNCTFKQVDMIYQWAIKNDVNWYMSFVGCETEYQDSLNHVGTNAGGGRKGMTWMADSGVNAQLAFTMRNCVFDGQYTYFKANGINYMTDIILDNNCYMNYEFAYDFFPNKRANDRTYENINGFLVARNTYQNIDSVFSEGSQELVKTALKTTNTAASKRLVIIDDGEANTNERKLGDVNADGKITIKDATYVTYYYVGKLELNLVQQTAADVNGDSSIDLKDSTLIKRFILGYIDKFPADTSTGGGNTGGGSNLPEDEEPATPPLNESPYEDLADDNLYTDGYY